MTVSLGGKEQKGRFNWKEPQNDGLTGREGLHCLTEIFSSQVAHTVPCNTALYLYTYSFVHPKSHQHIKKIYYFKSKHIIGYKNPPGRNQLTQI